MKATALVAKDKAYRPYSLLVRKSLSFYHISYHFSYISKGIVCLLKQKQNATSINFEFLMKTVRYPVGSAPNVTALVLNRRSIAFYLALNKPLALLP